MGRPERPAIVIAGAGIGGLTAAVALERRGHRVAVMERGGELSEVGAGITLWPNALAALDAVGLGAAIRQAGAAVVSGGIRTPEGSWLRRFDARRLTGALGEALVVVNRGALLAILASALDPATITFGVAVDSYRPGRDGAVEVRSSGGTVIAARGLIGADGTGSSVVRQLQPGLHLRYAGYTAWRGVAAADASQVEPAETWGPGESSDTSRWVRAVPTGSPPRTRRKRAAPRGANESTCAGASPTGTTR